jgi:hypothetical protein
MTLSFRILGRSVGNYASLFSHQQRIPNVFRGASYSCFLCGTSATPKFVSQKYIERTVLSNQFLSLTLKASGLLSAQKLHVGAASNLQSLTAVKNLSSTAARNDAASGNSSTQEERIYTGGLTSQIKALKIFSLTTSAIGLGVQPLVLTQFLAKYGSGATIGIFSALAFFTAVTPIMIHYIAKKYITELYYDKSTQTYKAITFSFLLGRVEVRICI